MNDYTLAHYFLSITSYHVSGAMELFILSDSNNDATGAITQRNNSEKKRKEKYASYWSTYYHSEILGNNRETTIIKYPNNFPTRKYQIINTTEI